MEKLKGRSPAAKQSKLEKAKTLVCGAGNFILSRNAMIAKPVIRDLSDLLEKAGYRVDEAKIERFDDMGASGRITFTVFPLDAMRV
jgi:hypothetical protein